MDVFELPYGQYAIMRWTGEFEGMIGVRRVVSVDTGPTMRSVKLAEWRHPLVTPDPGSIFTIENDDDAAIDCTPLPNSPMIHHIHFDGQRAAFMMSRIDNRVFLIGEINVNSATHKAHGQFKKIDEAYDCYIQHCGTDPHR